MMRALTLTQPWCGLVASGIKRVENRPRHMIKRDAIGTRFAIHASREIDEDIYSRIFRIGPELDPRGAPENERWFNLSRIKSAIIAVATLDAILDPGACGILPWLPEAAAPLAEDQRRWFFGPIGYVLRDVVALPTPVACRGWQGFWCVGELTEHAVRAELRRCVGELTEHAVRAELRKLRTCGALGVGIDKDGHCNRCGLIPDGDAECPPGFISNL
jgi:hypothetical protein